MRPDPNPDIRPTSAEAELLRYYPALLAFFRRKLPTRLKIEAEDLAQETLLAAWATLSRAGGCTVEARIPYMLGVARNKLNQVLRNGYRSRDVALEAILGDERGFVVRHAAEHRSLEVEWRERLWRALGQLKRLERAMLYLRFFEGLDNEAASRKLGVRPDAGSRLKYRALEKLREFLRIRSRNKTRRLGSDR